MPDPWIDYVADSFEYISKTSSRKAKEEMLRTLTQQPNAEVVAKELLSIALDWFRHFGVATLPDISHNECRGDNSAHHFFALVGKLEQGHFTRDLDMIMGVLHGFQPITAKWLRKCLLKDLKMGVSWNTVNKVWPGLIRIFECQLAEAIGDVNSLVYPLFVEPKIDGVRCIAIVKGDQVVFSSRGGTPLHNLQKIANEIILQSNYCGLDLSKGIVLDGELYHESLAKTLSVVRSSTSTPDADSVDKLKFHVFDGLTLGEWDTKSCGRTYVERSTSVQDLAKVFSSPSSPVQIIPAAEARSPSDVEREYENALSLGLEGVMLKVPDGRYTFERTMAWMKYKPHDFDEFEVVGYYEGEGRLQGSLGGFTVRVNKPGTSNFTKVGGGFTDVQRKAFWNNPAEIKKIKVKYKEVTADGALREPVFVKVTERGGSIV